MEKKKIWDAASSTIPFEIGGHLYFFSFALSSSLSTLFYPTEIPIDDSWAQKMDWAFTIGPNFNDKRWYVGPSNLVKREEWNCDPVVKATLLFDFLRGAT